jgi:hypothetical protein
MTRRLLGAIGVIGLSVVAAAPATASAATARQLTKISNPRPDQVVDVRGRIRVVVRSRARLQDLRITVNGRALTRSFRGSAGTYRATLRRGHGLLPGTNHLFVQTGGTADFDRVEFVAARRAPGLLKLTGVDLSGREAPVRVGVRVGDDATLRATLNGRRVGRAFRPHGRGYVGRLGADDGVRAGRNRLVVRAHRTARSGRSAVRDTARATFRVRGMVAAAGRDRVVVAGDRVELRGDSAGARGEREYRWAVLSAPRGGDAELEGARTATPEFVATTPGTYLVGVTVGAGSASSSDAVEITVQADVPPIGWRLETADDLGTIKLNGAPVPGTSCDKVPNCPNTAFVTWAVFKRRTLERVTSGAAAYDAARMDALLALADSYDDAAASYLMVVNISRSFGLTTRDRQLLAKLGAPDLRMPGLSSLPVSVVGVPGSPVGSAMVSAQYRGCNCVPPMSLANMTGYLRLNGPAAADFEFVRTDQVEFDTDASPTRGQITTTIGADTYTRAVPTDGSAGFWLVTVNSQTLQPLGQQLFVTNLPDGSETAAQAQLAGQLDAAVSGDNSGGRVLVLLQSFGAPKGQRAAWQSAQAAIERLGGNGQVFAQLNQRRPAQPATGRYALVGRAAMGARAAESSQGLTGEATDGKLRGLLARARDDQYFPMLADPTGGINFDLVRIVNRPTAPDGGFRQFTERGERAAEQFLARAPAPGSDDPLIMGLCAHDAPTCDVRKKYYERLDATSWATILTALGERAREACTAAAHRPNVRFTEDECQSVRRQLQEEVDARNRVEAYFGPRGLQGAFMGTAGLTALVNISAISAEIQRDVQPPAANNATSNALNIVSFALNLFGAGAGFIHPGVGSAAGGLGATFGLAGYLTERDGSPDLIGPAVHKRATELAVELAERYRNVSAYFTVESRIVYSDWTKMREVAGLAASDPKWRLSIDEATKQLDLATKQTIYQALIPVAYPVLYNLGTDVATPRDWICRSNWPLIDKRLFQNTGAGAAVSYLIRANDQGYAPNLMAVGATRATDKLSRAHVPAPTQALTDRLFRSPAVRPSGGIGLHKLQFYSPQNFRVFGRVLQQEKHTVTGPYGFWTCQSMPNPPGNAD